MGLQDCLEVVELQSVMWLDLGNGSGASGGRKVNNYVVNKGGDKVRMGGKIGVVDK